MIWVLALAATIPTANWMIGHVGNCIPGGPCLIPVAPGLSAPSGVLMVGLALVLRDIIHERLGWKWAMGAVAFGAVVSVAVAPAALAVASGVAFLISELADTAVYAPLRRKRLWLAVLLSGVAGALVDSAAFLWLAFGSLDYLAGNTVGKILMSAAAAVFLAIRAHRGESIKP